MATDAFIGNKFSSVSVGPIAVASFAFMPFSSGMNCSTQV